MITITRSSDCCGCNACVQRCPKKCITLIADHEGFLYPQINIESCIDCGLCEKVCPIINSKNQSLPPKKVIAAINSDENIRMNSSSGGIFSLLAEQIIKENGVVFGAKFDDNWQVVHDYTDTIDGLDNFRGAKYVQSKIGNSFILAEKFLKDGRKVLFSGTPCQIVGLKLYLKIEYINLFTVDIVCHGVPSPKIWDLYLRSIYKDVTNIKKINFRDKASGWKNYKFHIEYNPIVNNSPSSMIKEFNEPFYKNIYMRGFLSNLYLRPSCHKCPCKPGKYRSDMTIADFWGADIENPEMDDDKGLSLILYHSEKASYFNIINSKEISYQTILKYNSTVELDTLPHARRDFFFNEVNINNVIDLIQQLTKTSLKQKFTKNKLAIKLKFFCKKIIAK